MLPTGLKNQPTLPIAKKRLAKLPQTPGVYFFSREKIIYIGKAVNLRNRILSYFQTGLGPKTKTMLMEARALAFIEVGSEVEALLLEAALIKKYQPKYNFAAKDDKHPLYIKITKEFFPRVLTVRKAEALGGKAVFGPFPSSAKVYLVLKMVRKIFPFADHPVGPRPCLYTHLGLCQPCPNLIAGIDNQKLRKESTKKYQENIRMIIQVLSGKFLKVKKELIKKMVKFSKQERYEEAQGIRRQIEALDYLTQPTTPHEAYLENPNLREDIRREEEKSLRSLLKSEFPRLRQLKRIECFDISHLAGVKTVASMVTFIDGEPEKKLYRHFRLKQEGGNDPASLKEVIIRRKKYFHQWGKPDLIMVDGGKAQVRALVTILAKTKIPVVGLAKNQEKLYLPSGKSFPTPSGPALNLVQRIRNEAHRFAQKYHHTLLTKDLLTLTPTKVNT